MGGAAAVNRSAIKHTQTYNDKFYKVAYADDFHPNTASGVFGFHTTATVPIPSRSQYVNRQWNDESYIDDSQHPIEKRVRSSLPIDKTDAIFRNLLVILGYIPVIGLIIGAIRFHSSKDEPKDVKTAHRVRGVVEMFGLGLVFLIPDICVTAHRFWNS